MIERGSEEARELIVKALCATRDLWEMGCELSPQYTHWRLDDEHGKASAAINELARRLGVE